MIQKIKINLRDTLTEYDKSINNYSRSIKIKKFPKY